jgi:putative membrane protein
MPNTGVNHIEALETRQLMAAVVSLDLSSVIAGNYVGTLVPLDAASRQVLGVAGGASSGQGVGAGVVSKQDAAFLQRVESDQLKEIALGQLAQANAAGQEVRDFGAKMVADHTAVLAQVRALAASVGVTLGGTMSPADQASVTRLSKVVGIRFDRADAQQMVQSHRADVGEFVAERQRTGNAAVESFVIQTLPTLQSHLTAAEGLLAVAKGENRSNTIDLATPRAAIVAAAGAGGVSVSATITGAAGAGAIGGSLTIPNVATRTLSGTLAGRRLALNLLSGGQTTGVIDATVLGTARRIEGRLDDVVNGSVVHARVSLANTAFSAKKGNGGSNGNGSNGGTGTGNTLLGNGTSSTAGSNTGSNVGNTIGFGSGSAVSTGSGTAGSGTDSIFGTGTTDPFGSTGSSVFT